jgi:hypothetical protein
MPARTIVGVTAVVVSALLAAACGPTGPLIRKLGSSNDAAFGVQAARTAKEPARAVLGLDSQEAAVTSANYFGTLAPEGKEAKEQPMILVAPPSRERPAPLAPSVPKE